MLRVILSTFAVLSLCMASIVTASDQGTKDEKGVKATITKVDAKARTVTVKMKDKDGKDVEKTFKLAEDIRYFDSTGRAAAIDVFESGNEVLIIEREGMLKEMRKGEKKTDKQ
jgi:hypothetical protein